MLMRLLPLLLLLAGTLQAAEEVGTGPEPSTTPISWQLEFSFLDPERIEVQLPGQAEPEVYWYMVYTVTNRSPRTQDFFPLFQIVTDDLEVADTDIGISPLVFNVIRERHAITHKYMVHPTKAIGPLRSGSDNALESVAIWRDIDLSRNSFRIYAAGLSGEVKFVPNPAFDPNRPETETVTGNDGRKREEIVNPQYFTLRKTLEIRYTLPGSSVARPSATPQRKSIRWILR
jgi:hypothetical protein